MKNTKKRISNEDAAKARKVGKKLISELHKMTLKNVSKGKMESVLVKELFNMVKTGKIQIS